MSGSQNPTPKPNKSILSYFQPAASSQQTPSPQRSSRLPSFPDLSPPAPSSPLSYKATPIRKKPPPQEIRDSDDDEGSDDGYSDDSLEDLTALIGRGRPSAAPSGNNQPAFSTPRAKRTATGPFVSPLTNIPKHRFDIKALANDARRDNAINASCWKAKASTDVSEPASPRRGDDFDSAFTDIVKEKSGQDAHKVLRAVQRAEPIQSQARFCFFNSEYRVPPSSPVPKLPKGSPWNLLTQGNSAARERNLTSGMPQTMLAKNGGLPDAVFEWMLDELCIQKSSLVRREYCEMIHSCPDQVERLLTPERLEALFLRLGATDDIRSWDHEVAVSKPSQEPYQDHDWSNLESVLVLLGMIASHLSVDSAIYAARTLLRLSMDKVLIYNTDLLMAYEEAIQSLANAIPSSSWDSFVSRKHPVYGSRFGKLMSYSALTHAQTYTQPSKPNTSGPMPCNVSPSATSEPTISGEGWPSPSCSTTPLLAATTQKQSSPSKLPSTASTKTTSASPPRPTSRSSKP